MDSKIVDLLIIALVFLALFPTIWSSFNNPTWKISTIGNNATYTNDTPVYYNSVYVTIFGLVPLLVVVGLLYVFWNKNKGKGGVKL